MRKQVMVRVDEEAFWKLKEIAVKKRTNVNTLIETYIKKLIQENDSNEK